jgi:hypothetical protein
MQTIFKYILTAIFCIAITFYSAAQQSDIGGIGTIGLSKDFGRYWEAKIEQEVRFKQSYQSFDRLLTGIIVDFSILPKILKAGIEYDFLYQNKDVNFELKHRGSLALSTQIKIFDFDLNFRTRYQSTWQDELRGNYKYNPKSVWRNKLECTYSIFGSPIKPSASVELFCPTNGKKGFYMDSYRIKIAAKYKYSMHQSIEAFLRYDAELQQINPESILYTGIGWNYKL